ncbi:MAG: DeoR/GlpR family DNA-binding transcription regulator [Sedimentisphaerales bacterium]
MNNTEEFNKNRNGQSAQQRLDAILDLISTSGFTSVTEVAQQMNVSEMTIRRDFDKLEAEGLIRRAHGGAIAEHRTQVELDYRARQQRRTQEKTRIGQIAASLVQDGQSVFLDAGTTVLAMVKFLKQMKNLHIVTSSLPVQMELTSCPNINVILVGGQIFPHTMSYVGPLAIENIQSMRFDWAFLGTGGIDVDRGLTYSTLEEIPVKKAAAASAAKVAVLADSTKFGYAALSLIMPINSVDFIITDKAVESVQQVLIERKSRARILWPEQA